MSRLRAFARPFVTFSCAALVTGIVASDADAAETAARMPAAADEQTSGPRSSTPATLRQVVGSVDLGIEGAVLALVNRAQHPVRGPATARASDRVGTLGLGTVRPAQPATAKPAATTPATPRAELGPAARAAVNRVFAGLSDDVDACYSDQPGDSRPAFDDIEGAVVISAEGLVSSTRISDLPLVTSGTLEPCIEAALSAAQFPTDLVTEPSELRYRWLVRFARAD